MTTKLKVENNIHQNLILKKNDIELEEVAVSGNSRRNLQLKSAQNLIKVDKLYAYTQLF